MAAAKEEMTFDQEHLAFFEALGRSITAWADVEMALCGVAQATVRKPDRQAIAVGFLSVDVFRSKLQLAGNMVSHRHGRHKIFDRWLELQKTLGDLAAKRNKMAHRPVVRFLNAEPGRRVALTTWLVNSAEPPAFARNKPISGELCLRDIIAIEFEFIAIRYALWNFATRLRRERVFFPAALEQPKNPPEIRKIANHLHARLGHPRLSSRERRRLTETVAT
jgi:hypothetical protein